MQCEQWTLSTFQHREFCHPRLVCELSGSGGVRVFVILLEIIRVVFYMVHKLVFVAQDFVSRINVCLEGVGGDAPLVQQPTDSLGVFQRFGDNYSAHLVIEKKRSLIGQLLVNAVV